MTQILKLTTMLVCAASIASPGFAQSPVEAVVQQLRDQGFGEIEISRTMLGRTKIEAYRGDLEREIVVTSSGRILKDEVESDLDDLRDRDRDRDRDRFAGGVDYDDDDDGGEDDDDTDEDDDRNREREREREQEGRDDDNGGDREREREREQEGHGQDDDDDES